VCGDNARRRWSTVSCGGSPPRVWGQWRFHLLRHVRRRFTPTCVGTMHTMPGNDNPTSVHPHVCGDNTPYRRLGLSAGWFTPTCVGTMSSILKCLSSRAVHPHVCGDNSAAMRFSHRFYGSPPRVWGQYHRLDHLCFMLRFTPTCVGTISY